MLQRVMLPLLVLWTCLFAGCGGGGSEGVGVVPSPRSQPLAQDATVSLSWDPAVPLGWGAVTVVERDGALYVNGDWGIVSVSSIPKYNYKLHYGTAPGSCKNGQPIDVGANTTYTVEGLQRNSTYYFSLTAYDSFGESECSSEVRATMP